MEMPQLVLRERRQQRSSRLDQKRLRLRSSERHQAGDGIFPFNQGMMKGFLLRQQQQRDGQVLAEMFRKGAEKPLRSLRLQLFAVDQQIGLISLDGSLNGCHHRPLRC